MTFFRRRKRHIPPLNTTSLPDLIFTVLFFFILVTRMREVTLKVRYKVPEGTELTKMARRSAVIHIYIGTPAGVKGNSAEKGTRIQINNRYVDLDGITDCIAEEQKRMTPEDRENMTAAIKADRSTSMEVITGVKRALRRAGVTRICYSASFPDKKEDGDAR